MISMSFHPYISSIKINIGASTQRYTMANYMPISIQVLLCIVLLSSHACNARPFGAQLSCKRNEDCSMNKSVVPAAEPLSLTELVEAEENNVQRSSTKSSKKLEFSLDDYDPPKTHPPPPPPDPPVHNNLTAQSHDSVAWRVPHKEIGEKQPHFNLDYDPPKTHPPPPPPDPPVHNNLKAQSHDSVAWRVPHKEIGEKQPQFNLDYDPPRTHPPVHN